MRDTIYRDDAIRIASGFCHPANIVKELEKLPSAERKKGRWIECYPEGFWKCSKCNFVSEASAADVLYHYCPNCGCRMEVEREVN